MIDDLTKRRLLDVARAAARAQVLGHPLPVAPVDLVLAGAGVFVSLHHGLRLRGCLGSLGDREPLAEAVARLAAAVCHQDPRFAPVHPDELPALAVEISVLSPRRLITDIAEIEVGRHGLIVEQGWRTGLLLPQVATEHGWDRERFLAHTCLKANLPRDAWRKGASVYRFEAEAFADPGPSDERLHGGQR